MNRNMDSDSDEYRESSSAHEEESEAEQQQQAKAASSHDGPANITSTRQAARSHWKRRRESFSTVAEQPPRKRAKDDFNAAYLSLLNQDIVDAAARRIYKDDDPTLGHTQIGEVVWSPPEKHIFYAAVSCLGRHDVAGISARIGTKSEPEVRQYLVLLDAIQQRRSKESGVKAPRAFPPADIPAAVEIGSECDAALEAAADGLALRQQEYEEEQEAERWGPLWLVSPLVSPALEELYQDWEGKLAESQSHIHETRRHKPRPIHNDEGPEHRATGKPLPLFLELFRIQDWLQLSNRIFMNSAVLEDNWVNVADSDEEPAIQATAFADFHRLAVSITRRLVVTATYVAESRLRAKGSKDSRRINRKHEIRVEDVKAAIQSLGMEPKQKEFWARCARRLHLSVVVDGDEDDSNESNDPADQQNEETETNEIDSDEEALEVTTSSSSGPTADNTEENDDEDGEDNHIAMDYDEVEAVLGYPAAENSRNKASNPDLKNADNANENAPSESEPEPEEGENPEQSGDETVRQAMYAEEKAPWKETNEGVDRDAIARDIEEALVYSAPTGYIITQATPTQSIIRSRIWAEHRQQRDAEKKDLEANKEAEAELWAVLKGESNVVVEDDSD